MIYNSSAGKDGGFIFLFLRIKNLGVLYGNKSINAILLSNNISNSSASDFGGINNNNYNIKELFIYSLIAMLH